MIELTRETSVTSSTMETDREENVSFHEEERRSDECLLFPSSLVSLEKRAVETLSRSDPTRSEGNRRVSPRFPPFVSSWISLLAQVSSLLPNQQVTTFNVEREDPSERHLPLLRSEQRQQVGFCRISRRHRSTQLSVGRGETSLHRSTPLEREERKAILF